MVRNRFDRQLQDLNRQMTGMGKLCKLAITTATTALATGNSETAREVIRADAQIDQAERDIEHLCMKLLLQQQPVARDLRQISAALKMITDLERIGDQAADIAEIVLTSDMRSVADFPQILKMSDQAAEMVSDAIQAYVDRDLALSAAVLRHDEIVDDLFVKVRSELIDFIVEVGNAHNSRVNHADGVRHADGVENVTSDRVVGGLSNAAIAGAEEFDSVDADVDDVNDSYVGTSEEAEIAVDLMLIAKYLERIGDHATNVAEWVAFSITGVHAGKFDSKPE